MAKTRIFIPMRKHMRYYGKHLFAHALRDCLNGMGFDAKLAPSGEYKKWGVRKGDIVFYVDAGSTRYSMPFLRRRASKLIYFNMEPAEPRGHYPEANNTRVAAYARRIKMAKFDVVFDYNGNTTESFKRMGVNAFLLPIGYHESYERPRSKPYRAAVHFLGKEFHPEIKGTPPGKERWLKDRRGDMCDAIRRCGVRCRSHNFRASPQEDFDRFLWTPGVHLNIHRFPAPFQFGGLRVIAMLMANRRFVLTETCHWLPPGLTAGVHWDVASPEEFPQRAADWLRRPKACKRIGREGYEFIKKHHRLDVELERAMAEAGLLSV